MINLLISCKIYTEAKSSWAQSSWVDKNQDHNLILILDSIDNNQLPTILRVEHKS